MATTVDLLDSIVAQAASLRGLIDESEVGSWEYDQLKDMDDLLGTILEDLED